jgi:hypothetical protein
VFNVRVDLYILDRVSGIVLTTVFRTASREEKVVVEERWIDTPATFRLLTKETLSALCRDLRSYPAPETRRWQIGSRGQDRELRFVANDVFPIPGEKLEVMRSVRTVKDLRGDPLGDYFVKVGVGPKLAHGLAIYRYLLFFLSNIS